MCLSRDMGVPLAGYVALADVAELAFRHGRAQILKPKSSELGFVPRAVSWRSTGAEGWGVGLGAGFGPQVK